MVKTGSSHPFWRTIKPWPFLIVFLSLIQLTLGLAVETFAADVNVTATVDRNKMSVGDTFTLKISVSSESSVNATEPRLPPMADFEILNTWKGSRSQSTFVNGQFEVKRTLEFNYLLSPKNKGQIKLGSAEVQISGKTFRTKPITIQVAAGGGSSSPGGPAQNQGQPLDPMEEMDQMFGQLLQQRGFRSQPTNDNESFFIQVEVDKTEVFEGEQVTASWYIYTRGQIRNIDTLKYPSLKGFWKEDIEIATRLKFTGEVVNGIPYKKALLASYALFPIKPGKAKIDPYKARCKVLNRTRFGLARPRNYTKSSQAINIDVLPLPAENQPSDFTGAVGQFKVTSSLDSAEVPVNQPVTLKVRFDGRGNAKLIDLPALDLPSTIEVYDTKKESKFFKNGTSFREFEVLLIPREAGDLTLPPINVSVFNPETREYESQSTSEMQLRVIPGAGNEVIPSSPLAKSEADQPEKEFVPQLLLAFEDGAPWPVWKTASVWGGLYLLAFLFLLWRAYVELGWGKKSKDLSRLVSLRFREISQLADKGDWRKVGVETTNAVYFLLGEVSGQGGSAEEIDKMMLKAPPSLRREIAEPLKKLMSSFEVMGFAPEEVVGSLKDVSRMKKLIKEMELLLLKAVRLGLGSSSTDEEAP